MSFTAADQAERERARTSRGENLVLEAGAGTGKTTLLIDRIESLLRTGDATVTDIAAVTFTENAAATMKLRLRERLERLRASDAAPVERERAARALDGLERAQVSTIHAFCQAILQERPLECGVPPAFRVIDEAGADALFTEAWDEWLVERLDEADPVLAEAVRAHIPLTGVRGMGEATSLRGLARTLLGERDLAPLVSPVRPDPEAWRAELSQKAAEAAQLRAAAVAGDYMHDDLVTLEEFARGASGLRGTALRDRLLAMPRLKPDRGRRSNWLKPEALSAARALARWTGDAVDRWQQELGSGLHADLVASLQGVLRLYEEKKRREGVLDFVDLLVKARDGLRDHAGVRRHVRERFRHLLIDEFQDTDPLQVQVVRAIAGDDPGRLVVVGDAKQSIYRFRRADVALFRRLSEEAAQRAGHAVLHLRQSFRARPALLSFVNRAFAELITFSREADQPAYEPIVAPPGLAEGPAVVSLRFEAAAMAEGDDLLEPEAEAAAQVIAEAARGRYTVRDPATGEPRRSRAGDVMVLAPRLTQLRFLEDALEAAGVAFAVDGGKSFFGRQEVVEALATLKAIDDPSDRASLVAALRSCFFGVSDRDLVAYALSGGRLEIGAPPAPDRRPQAEEAVAPALDLLTRLHHQRLRATVPALLATLYDETRVLAALTGTRRGESRIANLEKVAALARQAGGVGVLTLRGFTRLLAARMQDSSEEPDLPAARPDDPDTVRILSIHKAKGLEAPVVVLHDLAASLITQPSVIALWDEGTVAVGFRKGYRPPDWNTLAQRDEVKARAEGRRLLYVACTRARDLLVVPRPPSDAQVGDFWRELLGPLDRASAAEAMVVDARTLPALARAYDGFDAAALVPAEGGDAVGARWQQRRRALLTESSRRPLPPVPVLQAAARLAPPAVAAAAVAGDTAGVLLDPAARGRGFGSLVHRILEWIPLDESTPEAVSAMATALAPSLGLGPDAAARAAETASRVLALPLLERARSARRVFRELVVWFPEGGELLEGVVDLVFEEDQGLVVVDYKTDHIAPAQAIEQAAHHAPQLQLYGRGLAQATGMKVAERLVLFTALGRAVPV